MTRAKMWMAAIALTGLSAVSMRTPADEPAIEKSLDKIVPVVMLKPGETKELLLSSSCARITRGQGLLLAGMGDHQPGRWQWQDRKWTKDGVTASFVDVADPELEVFKKKGLKMFTVRITASKDAKPAFSELHVTDNTCAGNCDVDFRLVVVAPSSEEKKLTSN